MGLVTLYTSDIVSRLRILKDSLPKLVGVVLPALGGKMSTGKSDFRTPKSRDALDNSGSQ